MKVILDANQIDNVLTDLTDRIVSDIPSRVEIAVIGIRSRGEILSDRLAKDIPWGTLYITLSRDYINDPQSETQPTVRSTEIAFDISDKIIILVDDVLYTGRSIRSALDALIDLGRPKAIRLAVLVDRGCRELPIQADYTGCKVDIAPDQSVIVNLVEADKKDQVIVE